MKFVDLVFVLPDGSGRYYRAALYPQEGTLVPFEYEVVWALVPVWTFFWRRGNSLSYDVIQKRWIVQPVA
jgi:hypothetical protein